MAQVRKRRKAEWEKNAVYDEEEQETVWCSGHFATKCSFPVSLANFISMFKMSKHVWFEKPFFASYVRPNQTLIVFSTYTFQTAKALRTLHPGAATHTHISTSVHITKVLNSFELASATSAYSPVTWFGSHNWQLPLDIRFRLPGWLLPQQSHVSRRLSWSSACSKLFRFFRFRFRFKSNEIRFWFWSQFHSGHDQVTRICLLFFVSFVNISLSAHFPSTFVRLPCFSALLHLLFVFQLN